MAPTQHPTERIRDDAHCRQSNRGLLTAPTSDCTPPCDPPRRRRFRGHIRRRQRPPTRLTEPASSAAELPSEPTAPSPAERLLEEVALEPVGHVSVHVVVMWAVVMVVVVDLRIGGAPEVGSRRLRESVR